jgi:hypothetical protein
VDESPYDSIQFCILILYAEGVAARYLNMFDPHSARATFFPTPDGEIMNVIVECRERLDSHSPRCPSGKATIQFDYIPYSRRDFETGTAFVLDRANQQPYIEDLEASIYNFGFHNPVEIQTLAVHPTSDASVSLHVSGRIDFTHEGLSRLGRPEIVWRIEVTHFDSP